MAVVAQVEAIPAPTAPSTSPNVANIFRRRLGLAPLTGGPRRPGPVRCLFGPPDVSACATMAQKVEEKNQWAFSKKWNFNITGKDAPPTLEPSSAEESAKPPKYEWNETYDEEHMWKCDRIRFEAPIAPNARPFTLLSAPITELSVGKYDEEQKIKETTLVPENLVMSDAPTPITINLEYVSVQTETEPHLSKGMQVNFSDTFVRDHRKPKCELSLLDLFSISVPGHCPSSSCAKEPISHPAASSASQKSSCTQESLVSPPPLVKKERPLPIPLTIPPISPNPLAEECHDYYEGDDRYDVDEAFSPLPDNTTFSRNFPVMTTPSDIMRTPTKRRSSVGVFSFESPTSNRDNLRGLRIRNGSPARAHSASKAMKQSSLTGTFEFAYVKKGF
ncbi:uncharacterized protein LOC110851363 isoform X1 [Folsomia candida]|uniref:uncharacterized protein LOC110851363 isoform X1 n=1 Tax=Folsomia candida TaxID=158441 RepID=UPI000B8FB707|nr:uncharacterized protein LOC110851363 isoform X1 [Folsomia candida]XP_035708842.1 uncharacterized protein LOC110851363 isoform X1 [Folsomia candida]XP_035708843.1 uncharacterized protein LOC110851363 isoform X1 [Folsomia candida]